MKYIDSWLTGLGLEYIVPKLKANGITTPKKLAALRFIILFYINLFLIIILLFIFIIYSLREMYEVVGVEDADDRKNYIFLFKDYKR